MFYDAIITREGRQWLAECPACPGCQTFASGKRAIEAAARDALHGWLEAHLVGGSVPPAPTSHRSGGNVLHVEVDPLLAVRVLLRQARDAAGLTQAELARRAGVTQQMIAKLERPGANASMATLKRVACALGLSLEVRFAPPVRSRPAA